MSLKKELETWSSALQAYDTQNIELAISEFDKIADTAKIHWNIGLILATMGRHEEAVIRFGDALESDGFLTVGWWQRGVSYFVSVDSAQIG
jgi:neutrophil factor 2